MMKLYEILAYKSDDRNEKNKFVVRTSCFEEAVSKAYYWRSTMGPPQDWKIQRVRELSEPRQEETRNA